MMMKNLAKCVFSIAVLAACFAPRLGLAGLVGEPAPPLNVSQWLKGGPMDITPGTNIYVLEIWETHRTASQASVTNLNEIQRAFKDKGVVVLAVSDEPADQIKTFVEKEGTNIEFAVAGDNKRHTSLAYMKPIDERVIPFVFVVGTNGDLLWHGPPEKRVVETVLRLMISGQYDENRAKDLDLARHQMMQYLTLAGQGSDRTGPSGRVLLATRTNDVSLLCDMAHMIATYPKLKTRDFPLAADALDRAEQLSANSQTNLLKVQFTRAIVLFESGQQDEGLAKAKLLLDSAQTPFEKTNVQAVVQYMENRMAKEPKSGDAPAANTNQPAAHAGNL
jgi:peroxiredoxin